MQTLIARASIAAALALAESRGERVGAEHLLIALLDQGMPGVAETLSRAGLEPATVRRVALAGIGAPADLPSLTMPALAPVITTVCVIAGSPFER